VSVSAESASSNQMNVITSSLFDQTPGEDMVSPFFRQLMDKDAGVVSMIVVYPMEKEDTAALGRTYQEKFRMWQVTRHLQ
jgi:hypothetical protein